MSRKPKRSLITLLEAGLFVVLFLFIFITAEPDIRYAVVLFFGVALIFGIYLIFNAREHVKRIVRRLTDEISILPNDLSEKTYDFIEDDAAIFFEELTRVKSLLNQRSHARQEILDIVNTVAMNMEFSKLLRELMPLFNDATHSSCSAFYAVNSSTNKLEIKHSVGFSKNIYSEFDLTLGEGMIGQAALKKEISILKDIPEDTVYLIRSFLGKIKPRCIMVSPVYAQDKLAGVMVSASIYDYTREDRDMVELIKHYLGVAVHNGVDFEKTKRLTNELTFQNKLIQDQYEEMKNRLKDKTELIDQLMQYVGDGCLYALDKKNAVLVWNNGAERMHSIARNVAAGKTIGRLYDEYHWPSIDEPIRIALQDGQYQGDFRRTAPDEGEERLYYLSISRMDNDHGEVLGVIVRITEAGK